MAPLRPPRRFVAKPVETTSRSSNTSRQPTLEKEAVVAEKPKPTPEKVDEVVVEKPKPRRFAPQLVEETQVMRDFYKGKKIIGRGAGSYIRAEEIHASAALWQMNTA